MALGGAGPGLMRFADFPPTNLNKHDEQSLENDQTDGSFCRAAIVFMVIISISDTLLPNLKI
jgi:hypothetical protein